MSDRRWCLYNLNTMTHSTTSVHAHTHTHTPISEGSTGLPHVNFIKLFIALRCDIYQCLNGTLPRVNFTSFTMGTDRSAPHRHARWVGVRRRTFWGCFTAGPTTCWEDLHSELSPGSPPMLTTSELQYMYTLVILCLSGTLPCGLPWGMSWSRPPITLQHPPTPYFLMSHNISHSFTMDLALLGQLWLDMIS